MKIIKGIEIVKNYPVLFVQNINAFVVADLHLGKEAYLREDGGIAVPDIQVKKEVHILKDATDVFNPEKLIILGDVKHDFSGLKYEEKRAVETFFSEITGMYNKIIITKGNHDNFLIPITEKYGIDMVDEYVKKGILFMHGHKMPKYKDAGLIIMGNEHPNVALYDSVGAKEVMKCFLYGNYGRRIIVIPAMSPLSYGTEMNIVPKEALLSPILRHSNLDAFKVFCISEDVEKVLCFGTLGELKKFGK